MHIEIIPNRNSKPAILLRESYRDGKKVRKRTLGNLSKLPMEQVMAIKRVLAGEQLVSTDDLFEIVENGSRAHGDVDAVLTAMRRLGFKRLLCSRHSHERDLVVAMVATRILEPQSKLATTRWWSSTTLPDMLGIGAPDEDELYNAMDWLLERTLENRLRGANVLLTAPACLEILNTCHLNIVKQPEGPSIYSITEATLAQSELLQALNLSHLTDDSHVSRAITPRIVST